MMPSVVLIVEDEPTIAELLHEVLSEDLGVETRVARTGADALAQLGQLTPALVLLDLVLPDMWGEDLAHAIRTLLPEQTPLVICSAISRMQRPDPACSHANAYLRKPFELDDLTRTVRQLLLQAGDGAHQRAVPA